MKKLVLSLCIVTSVLLNISCSSDDGGGSDDPINKLTATIDGESVTFNSIQVIEVTGTDTDVIATINNDATRTMRFSLGTGYTGNEAIFYVEYEKDNIEHWSESPIIHNVSVNNGSKIEFTFSGTLTGYNPGTQEQVSITFDNGSLYVEY